MWKASKTCFQARAWTLAVWVMWGGRPRWCAMEIERLADSTVKRETGSGLGYRNLRKFTEYVWTFRTNVRVVPYMRNLRAAIEELEAEDDDFVDPSELSRLGDRLQAKLCR